MWRRLPVLETTGRVKETGERGCGEEGGDGLGRFGIACVQPGAELVSRRVKERGK